jgi:nitrite reductase (cytochrome c-552)
MSSKDNTEQKRGSAFGWALFGGSAIGVFGLGLLASSISSRRAESDVARVAFTSEIPAWEADNAKWGESFPREYNSWEATKAMNDNTKYGGSGHRDYLEDNPKLVIMFAGYGFSKEFYQARGHFHAVEDVTNTERVGENTPGTCWTCKSPDVPRVMDERGGPADFYSDKFMALKSEIKNPIGCADCHNNETMALQVSRPALAEAFERQGKDINKVSHQEMRTLVCAQCHVEYYFKGKEEKYLTFPWDNGLTVENFEQYFAETGHVDWTHAVSGAKMVKMQHPDYEVYMQGVHAFQGVSCADCHMPYKSEGGVKFTDHKVQSPLYNIANSCQVCHKWSETEVKDRVTSIQDKNREIQTLVEEAITRAHLEIGDTAKAGATDEELDEIRKMISLAQMYWDYVAANNGMGFHAPQETARILGKSLNFAKDCRIEIVKLRAGMGLGDYTLPDISTEDSAKAFVAGTIEAKKAAAAPSESKAS